MLQKVNLPKLIDRMEQDQELADQLEFVNEDTREEEARNQIVRESLAACRAAIEEHLVEFLMRRPHASYEQWIQELHPENVSPGGIFDDLQEVDSRFYVKESDHRILWNSKVAPRLQVAPRTVLPEEEFGLEEVDLLMD